MNTNRSMPPSTIIPELPYTDLRAAADWLCRVFSFKERLPTVNHRTQLIFGDGSMVVTQGGKKNVSFNIMVRVNDIDLHCTHVSRAGARIIYAPADYPHGERQSEVEDVGGHRWIFSQTIADVDPKTWGGILAEV